MRRNARRFPRRRLPQPCRLLAALAVPLLVAACGPQQEDTTTAVPSVEPERIENAVLGIALAGPQEAGFEVGTNEGETLVLVRRAQGEEAEATLTYQVSPPQNAGVNLVEAVKLQKAEIESRPDGHFLGQVELMSQFGSAFSTRGRYAGDDGRETEEIKVFAVHPSGDRLLSLTYRYPVTAGGSKERSQQAMAALGLVEPLAAAEGAAAPPAPTEDAGGEARVE
jgi:hypothetical protein